MIEYVFEIYSVVFVPEAFSAYHFTPGTCSQSFFDVEWGFSQNSVYSSVSRKARP